MIAHTNSAQHVALMIAALAATAVFGRRWLTTRSPAVRLWCWAGGMVALAAALTPWMETIAAESFTGHMTQHVLIIAVAAPLLVLAHPFKTMVPYGSLPPKVRRSTHALSRTWHRGAAFLAPMAFIGVLVVTHLSDIYDSALRHQWVHDIEHVAYLLASCGLWALMLAAGRRRGIDRVAGVFAVIAGMAFLGVILLTADHALIDTYADRHGAEDALDDQRIAASIMWVTGMIITVPLLVVTVWRWATVEQLTTERHEAYQRSRSGTPPSPPPPS